MMGFGSSRTHLLIHSLLCPASPLLQTSGQELCVCVWGGPLSVPSQIPFVSNSSAVPWECRRKMGDYGN